MMTITLRPEQEHAIEQAIRAGKFQSIDEFIDAAIAILANGPAGELSAHPRKSRLWELREGLNLGETSLRELIDEGRQ